MQESILRGKRILAVDDEPDILDVLKEEILAAAPDCILETAASYEEASQQLISWTYDLVILDIMGVRGFDLLKLAVSRPYPIPVVMLTAHALSPESLKESIEMGARAYLPKERLGAVVPFLEDGHTFRKRGWERWSPSWRMS
jgi:CheY-like chemotaxis protein